MLAGKKVVAIAQLINHLEGFVTIIALVFML
jgi:hypothetical protein